MATTGRIVRLIQTTGAVFAAVPVNPQHPGFIADGATKGDDMSAEQKIDTNKRPSWRARRYGHHRARGQLRRAYLFANREGRRNVRILLKIKRENPHA
jgi:hypothetical protein